MNSVKNESVSAKLNKRIRMKTNIGSNIVRPASINSKLIQSLYPELIE